MLFDVTPCDDCGGYSLGYGERLAESRVECSMYTTHDELAAKHSFLNRNFDTDYPIGHTFTSNHVDKTVIDVRKDEDGDNEHMLNDDRWVTGKYITVCCD